MRETCYVYHAIRRRKDNPGLKDVRNRLIVADDVVDDVFDQFYGEISQYPGTWRIYRSVNRRDVKKAEQDLVIALIERAYNPASVSSLRVDALWKKILMQPRNRAESLFLIDVDTHDLDVVVDVERRLVGVEQVDKRRTPNGWHLVYDPFNPKLLEGLDSKTVEIKKDALLYEKTVEVVK